MTTDVRKLVEESADDTVTVELTKEDVELLWTALGAGHYRLAEVADVAYSSGLRDIGEQVTRKLQWLSDLLHTTPTGVTLTVESERMRNLRADLADWETRLNDTLSRVPAPDRERLAQLGIDLHYKLRLARKEFGDRADIKALDHRVLTELLMMQPEEVPDR